MAVKDGDFIKLEFIGKTKDDDRVFDTTIEEIAKKTDMDTDKKTFGPIPIIVGGGHLIPGLDKSIVGMAEGDKKTVELKPEDAYGERDPKQVQLVPMKEFKKQGINPYVGMPLTIENTTGRVLTVSGGRVKVDFNHQLAGKTVIYDIEIKEIIKDNEEKVRSMIKLHYPDPNLDVSKANIDFVDDKIIISLDEVSKFDNRPYMDISFARFRIAKDIWDNIEDINKVEFTDVFEKKDDEEIENEEASEENDNDSKKVPEVLTDSDKTDVSSSEK